MNEKRETVASILKWKVINLKINDVIKFEPIMQHFGRSEFMICPVFKHGYLDKIYIEPLQPESLESNELRKTYVFDCKGKKQNSFRITTKQPQYEKPSIWCNFWCIKHKTIAFRVYVPKQCNRLRVRISLDADLIFEREGDDNE